MIEAIMVICYLITEICKLFMNKKYLPIVASISGLILGIISYYLIPDVLKVDNVLEAIKEGIISGLAAIGSNEIIKRMKGKKDNE